MGRRRNLCVDSIEPVDLTLDTDEPVSPLARKEKDWKDCSKQREHRTSKCNCACRQQADRDEKLSQCANETSWILRNCGFCIQVGIRIRCMSQAQYMVVRPCYLCMVQKDNWNLCNGGSNFRFESDLSPCCVLFFLLIVKVWIWSQGVHVVDPLGSEMVLNSSDGDDLSSNALLKFPSGSTTVFCPINIHNRHWILLILRCLTNKIEV